MKKQWFASATSCAYRNIVVVSLVILVCMSCQRDAPATGDQPADVQPTAGQYSLQGFGQLRWLEGDWRGALPDGGHFYERYRTLDDSTIVMHSFADSTLARATDSARISLRNGTVTDEGDDSRWVATRLDSSAVDFAAATDASRGFTWKRESADRWTATLRSIDRERRPRTTVYQMQRIVR